MAKSVLITGCSEGGIGDALAMEFHSKGARVFATARTLSKTKHLKAMGMETLSLDVTSAKSIQSALAIINGATGGKLDILVNNSGSGKHLRFSKPCAWPLRLSDAMRLLNRIFDASHRFGFDFSERHVWCERLCRCCRHSSLRVDDYCSKRESCQYWICRQSCLCPLDG